MITFKGPLAVVLVVTLAGYCAWLVWHSIDTKDAVVASIAAFALGSLFGQIRALFRKG